MRFSQSTHLLMFLSLETLTSIIRTGLPILVELIDLVNSVIIFLSQMTLPKWLTFLLGSQTVILIVLLFWIDFFLLTLVFVLRWLSLHWEIVIMLLSQFPLTFHQIHNWMPFHRIAYDYSHADWHGFRDHLRDVPWEDIFKLSAYAAASEFCEWLQVRIDVYNPYRKCQVKPHSSLRFSASCAAAIVHRNPFFRLYQKDKSSDSKVKFRQASNRCKRVLEASKLAYATKTKESIFWQLCLIELLGLLTGLWLLKLLYVIYPRFSTEFSKLVFFTNLDLMEFQVRYSLALFFLFSVISGPK